MTYKKYQNLWNELTLKLNDIGPSKNIKDWQKVCVSYYITIHKFKKIKFLTCYN